MNYFVVMQDHGNRGREAIVDPEITRRETVSRIASGEYRNIAFIHSIQMFLDGRPGEADDVTEELIAEANALQQAAE